MIIVTLQQGTNEWHAFRNVKFTASDAAAMMGLSNYKSRDQLLREKKFGIIEEVTPEKQRLFDRGHAAEEAQRSIFEAELGDDLFPATAYSEEWDRIAASFDGVNMLEDTIFEHKLWSQSLVDYIKANGDLPDTHWPQVEQQLYVSGAAVCYFVVSDGTDENRVIHPYYSHPERISRVIEGWRQFEKDLETYKAKDIKEKPAAEAIRDLPALNYKLDRTTLTLQSNLGPFKQAAMLLVEKSREPLKTDQDFANAEAMVKVFKSTEDKLAMLIDGVMGEIVDVDAFVKDVRQISESIRQARLSTDKQVKSRKEEIKVEIVSGAVAAMMEYVSSLNAELSPFAIPSASIPSSSVFADAMKGKKALKSCHDAVDEAMALVNISLNKAAGNIKANASKYSELADGFDFLFPDIGNLISGESEWFTAIVKGRISDHKEQQERKREQEAAQAEADAKAKAEAAKAKAEADAAPVDVAAPDQSVYEVRSVSAKPMFDPSIAGRIDRIANSDASTLVSIDRMELEELRDKAAKYDALVAAGVYNWDGFSKAMGILEAAE